MKKGLLLAIGFMVVALTASTVGGTYARYVGESTGTGTGTAAAFLVKVDDASSLSAASLGTAFTIAPVFTDSDLVRDGRIAPTQTGYFDIVIDPTGSEVALDVTVDNITLDGTNLPTDFTLTTYQVKTGDGSFNTGTNIPATGIEQTISLPSQTTAMGSSQVTTIRVNFTWTGAVNTEDMTYQGSAFNVTGDVTVEQSLGAQ